MDEEREDLLYRDIKQVRQGAIKFSKEYKAKLALKHAISIISIVLLILIVSYVGYRIADNSVPTPDGRAAYTEALKDAKRNDKAILYKNKIIKNENFNFINRILSHTGIQETELVKIIATPHSMLLPDDKGNNIVLSESQFFIEYSSGSRQIIDKSIILGIVEDKD